MRPGRYWIGYSDRAGRLYGGHDGLYRRRTAALLRPFGRLRGFSGRRSAARLPDAPAAVPVAARHPGRTAGTVYHAHHRRPDGHLAHERHDPLFRLLRRTADHAPPVHRHGLSADQPGGLCSGDLLRRFGHCRRHSHGHRPFGRRFPRPGRRRHLFRRLFRRPRLAGLVGRQCGGRSDPYRYLRQRALDAPDGRAALRPDDAALCCSS